MRARVVAILWIATLWSSGCATSPRRTPARPAPSSTLTALRPLPKEIRWFRTSAEYRALAVLVYRDAADRLPALTQGLAPQSWGVIVDADETILDNSEYQRRRTLLDSGYTEAAWSAWVRERAAGPIPGAVEFAKLVRSMRGRVAIVTNRADSLCAPTRESVQNIGVEADIVLCQPPGESDKSLRFQRIQSGAAAASIQALAIV